MPDHPSFDAQGPTPVEQPDWQSIFRADEGECGGCDPYHKGLHDGQRQGLQFFIRLLRWADGHGQSRAAGLRNRAIVLEWLFNPSLVNLKQTDLLSRYGIRDKQLLNHELTQFRDAFNAVDPRFFTESGREALTQAFGCGDSTRDARETDQAGSRDQ